MPLIERAVHSGCWRSVNNGPAHRKQTGGSTNQRLTTHVRARKRGAQISQHPEWTALREARMRPHMVLCSPLTVRGPIGRRAARLRARAIRRIAEKAPDYRSTIASRA
jgi:hypothetical protein